jgi:hypothetical protein
MANVQHLHFGQQEMDACRPDRKYCLKAAGVQNLPFN